MFENKILEYWDEIVKDLTDMIAIPSVSVDTEGKYPFGENSAKAIDLAMDLCKKYDLNAKNVDYYACHAEIGSGEENAVVMAHLDVVPVGEGWDTDPYTLVRKDGYFYGRGVSDNKGPAIIALHCLRILRDMGVVGKRKLRVVMGSGEEIGMRDMVYYFDKEQTPTLGFTPDGGYGVCHCEKGLLKFKASAKNNSSVIKSFVSGTVVNAVPYKAEAVLVCTEEEFDLLNKTAFEHSGDFVITKTADGAEILSKGTAAHGSTPALGLNAASMLNDLLVKVFGDKVGSVPMFMNDKIGTTYDGSLFDIKSCDEESGELTFNLGLVNIDENTADFSIDIRYPATKKGADYIKIITDTVVAGGLNLDYTKDEAPLYIPKDSKLIKLLSSAYEDVTDNECTIFSMGGGTYARQMRGNGVAFGASFKEESENAHNANENSKEANLKLHAQICLEAMYRIFTADLD